MPSVLPDPRIYGAVPLSKYKVRAVVDRIGVVIRVHKPIGRIMVRRALANILGLSPTDRKPAVWARDGKPPNGVATVFKFYLQEVARYSDIDNLMKRLSRHFPFNGPPRVYTLELALDFYSKANDRLELETMATRLMRETFNDCTRPRQYVRRHPNSAGFLRLLEREDEDRELKADETFYVGPRHGGGLSYKVYLKETDRGKRIQNIADHRTRIEFTEKSKLPYESLPSLVELKGKSFQGMANYFQFRHVVMPEPQRPPFNTVAKLLKNRLEQRTLLKWARIGINAVPIEHGKIWPIYTRADADLTKIARDKLWRLSERWRK